MCCPDTRVTWSASTPRNPPTSTRIAQLREERVQPGLRRVPLALDVTQGHAVLAPPALDFREHRLPVANHPTVQLALQVRFEEVKHQRLGVLGVHHGLGGIQAISEALVQNLKLVL